MKILYATRLFSGLHSSLANGNWQPTGVPTIYRLIEALDARAEPTFVFAAKDVQSQWRERQDRIIALKGLRHAAHVLAGRDRFPAWMRPVSGPLREIVQAFAIWRLCRRVQPDLVYLDHANIFVAGALSVLTNRRIVLRIMGVYPVMREALLGRNWRDRLMRWCYRRPYALVICSQDGSGVEQWLEQALSPQVPRLLLINGVDPLQSSEEADARLQSIPAGKTVVAFIGKLESEKGALEFADGFIKAWRQSPDDLHALVIGTGALEEPIRAAFAQSGAQAALTLIDRLAHEQVATAHARSDIYVSLNKLGNLSNANLEAMRAGKAIVIPRSQPEFGIDLATDQLFPPDTILRIPSAHDTQALAGAILHLAENRQERRERGERTAKVAAAVLESWANRIDREMQALEELARTGSSPVAANTLRPASQGRSAGTTA